MSAPTAVPAGLDDTTPSREVTREGPARRGVGWRRILVLFGVLFALAQLPDPAGYLGDSGLKGAALEAMHRNGGFDPDLGYWASDADPDATFHPFRSTVVTDDGRYVNVPTLPMLMVAEPLYALGGMRLALAVPVAGAVAAAAAVGALAARLVDPDGAARARRWAFWLVGLASPVTVYALDPWEHTWGVATMVAGVVLVLDARTHGAPMGTRLGAAAGAGLAFGVAATLRQEALVYGLVAGCVLVAPLARRGRRWAPVVLGAAMAAATLVVLVANTVLEEAVIGSALRVARSAGTAALIGGEPWRRLREALVTGFGTGSVVTPPTVVIYAAVVTGVVVAARSADDDWPRARRALLVAVGALVVGVLDLVVVSLRFVPGLVATTPLAAVGLARARRLGARGSVTALIAGVGAVLVWATQYLGGAGPQWGGRYILTTGACGLALAAASAAVAGPGVRRVVAILAVVGVAVTGVGVVWTVERTHVAAAAMTRLAERPEEVLVFEHGFLAREGGALALDEHWLALPDRARADDPALAELLGALGVDRVGLVELERGEAPTVVADREPLTVDRIDWIGGLELRVSTYDLVP